jgi:hypothetical protein
MALMCSPRAEYIFDIATRRRSARDDESEAVYDRRQSGGSPARRVPVRGNRKWISGATLRQVRWCFRSPRDHGTTISTGCERWISLTTSWKSVISPRTTCAIGCRRRGASVAEFLLDTDAASRLMRAERSAITNVRQCGAKTVSISSVTMAELVYGARLREDNPSVCPPSEPSSLAY